MDAYFSDELNQSFNVTSFENLRLELVNKSPINLVEYAFSPIQRREMLPPHIVLKHQDRKLEAWVI